MNDAELLFNGLRNAIHPHKGKIAVAFSGGLDSSVIAKIASEEGEVALYTVGLKNCKDFEASQSAAQVLGLRLKLVELKEKDILKAAPLLAQVIANDNKLIISYELPLWFVCKNCSEKTVMSGQGADELFGGYAKYQKMKGRELKAALKKDSEELRSKGIELDRAVAGKFGKELVTPFLDDNVFSFVLGLSLDRKVADGRRKIILREVAELLGLGEIAERKKRAAQYGSGIAKVLRRRK